MSLVEAGPDRYTNGVHRRVQVYVLNVGMLTNCRLSVSELCVLRRINGPT